MEGAKWKKMKSSKRAEKNEKEKIRSILYTKRYSQFQVLYFHLL